MFRCSYHKLKYSVTLNVISLFLKQNSRFTRAIFSARISNYVRACALTRDSARPSARPGHAMNKSLDVSINHVDSMLVHINPEDMCIMRYMSLKEQKAMPHSANFLAMQFYCLERCKLGKYAYLLPFAKVSFTFQTVFTN